MDPQCKLWDVFKSDMDKYIQNIISETVFKLGSIDPAFMPPMLLHCKNNTTLFWVLEWLQTKWYSNNNVLLPKPGVSSQSSVTHFMIDANNCSGDEFLQNIKNITCSMNVTLKKHHIFIFDIDKVVKHNAQFIKNTIDHCGNDCVFIMTCSNTSKISESLKSRCAIFKCESSFDDHNIWMQRLVNAIIKKPVDKNVMQTVLSDRRSIADPMASMLLMQAWLSSGKIPTDQFRQGIKSIINKFSTEQVSVMHVVTTARQQARFMTAYKIPFNALVSVICSVILDDDKLCHDIVAKANEIEEFPLDDTNRHNLIKSETLLCYVLYEISCKKKKIIKHCEKH
jgi:hypothetical protein